MLKGTNWGVAKIPLLTLYRALIGSVIEYGMEAYFFSSVSALDKIHKIQFEALRLCTGAMRSTPSICLLHTCGELPLHIKHKLICLKHKTHLLTFPTHPTMPIISDSCHELYPDTPNYQSFTIFTRLEITAIYVPNIPPWSICKHNIDFSLTSPSTEQNRDIIKQKVLSHLHAHYTDYVLVYTDGSKSKEKNR